MDWKPQDHLYVQFILLLPIMQRVLKVFNCMDKSSPKSLFGRFACSAAHHLCLSFFAPHCWCVMAHLIALWIAAYIKGRLSAPIVASCRLMKQHIIRNFNHILHICTIFPSALKTGPNYAWGLFSRKQNKTTRMCYEGENYSRNKRRAVRESLACTLNCTAMSVCDEKRSGYTRKLPSGQVGSIQDTQPPSQILLIK